MASFFDGGMSGAALSNQAASGQRLSGSELTGEVSGDDAFSKADPLLESKSTAVFDIPGVNSHNAPQGGMIAGDSHDPVVPGETGVGDADTKPTLTPGQTLGLGVASAGAAYMQGITEIKSQEADALHTINQNYANFEFTHRLNKSARKASETRSMLNSIKNIQRQAVPDSDGTQTQQFTNSPTERVPL